MSTLVTAFTVAVFCSIFGGRVVTSQPIYLGCWADMAAPSTVLTVSTSNVDRFSSNSIEWCAGECGDLGFDIIALKNGDECWCTDSVASGSDYTRYGLSTECTTSCPGTQVDWQYCGGEQALSVYRIAAQNCELHGGLMHPHMDVCCAPECGDLCGADNCDAGGSELCCGSVIEPSGEICGVDGRQAPCNLQPCFIRHGYHFIPAENDYDRYYQPNGLDTTWEDCRDRCIEIEGCSVWTFREETHPMPFTCDLGNFTDTIIVEGGHLSCSAKTCRTCQVYVDGVSFSSAGDRLLIAFSAPTNRGGALEFDPVDCSRYFVSSTLNRFGVDPVCQWESPSFFVVVFGENAELLWEDEATPPADSEVRFQTDADILPRISLLADNSALFYSHEVYYAQFPGLVERPIARLSAPSVVEVCSGSTTSITLDGSASTGFAGRTPIYEFRSVGCTAYTEVSQTSASSEWTLIISSADGAQDQACTFELTVENFLGARSQTVSVIVEHSFVETFRVDIIGPQTNTWRRSTALALEADIAFEVCNSSTGVTQPQVSYEWALSSNGALVSLPASVDHQSQTLVIPKHFLNITEYEASCVATTSTVSSTSQYTMSIERSPLVAAISGANDFVLGASSGLQLVANELSRDVDFPEAELSFSWVCSLGSDEEATCPGFSSLEITGGVLTVPLFVFTAGNTYAIAVQVASPVVGGISAMSETVHIAVVQEEIPQVSITGDFLINARDTLRLEGSVVGSNPVELDYVWSETSGSGVLSGSSSQPVAAQLTLGVLQRNLVIEPGLLDVGEIYMFQLSVTNRSTGLTGTAVAQVQVFAGPVISSFTIVPTSTSGSDDQSLVEVGESSVALAVFDFEAVASSNGAADTRPFRYRFLYSDNESEDSYSVSHFSFENSVEAAFLPGQYVGKVEVLDTLGQISTATTALNLSSLVQGPCSLDTWFTALEGSLARGDVSASLQLILELARGAFTDATNPFGSGCIAAELDETTRRLFAVLEMLYAEDRLLLRHAQQLSQALLMITSSPTRIDAAAIKTSVLITSLLITFAEDLVVDDLTEAKAVTDDCGVILSNLLSTDETAASYETIAKFCSTVFDIQEQLERYFALQLGPLLAGESIDLLDAATLAGGVSRADVTSEGISLAGGKDDLAFTADIRLSESSTGVVSLVVVTLSSPSVRRCFEDNQGVVPEGPIVIIETDHNISSVEFTLRFDDFPNSTSCQELVEEPDCGFINETTLQWDTSGCRVVERIDLGGGEGTLLCVCDHLTTFAVIKSLRINDDFCLQPVLSPRLNENTIYVFSAVYLFFAFYLIWQIHRGHLLRVSKLDNIRINTAFAALVILFALCLTQIAWLVLYWLQLSVVAVAVFISAARVMTFWVCSMMLFIWMSIVTMQIGSSAARKRSRALAATLVILATSVLIAIAIGLAVTPVNSPEFLAVERIGTVVLCMFNVGALLGFAVSGFLLIKKVRDAAKAANVSRRTKSTQKIRRLSIIFSVVFFAQTVIAFISGVLPNVYAAYFDMLTTTYVVLDVVVLVTVTTICTSIFTAHEDYSKGHDPYGSGSNKMSADQRRTPSLSHSNLPSKSSIADRHMRSVDSRGGGYQFSSFAEPSATAATTPSSYRPVSPPVAATSPASYHNQNSPTVATSPSFHHPGAYLHPSSSTAGHRGSASTSLQPLRDSIGGGFPSISRHSMGSGFAPISRSSTSTSGGFQPAAPPPPTSRAVSPPPHQPYEPANVSSHSRSATFASASSPGRAHMHGPYMNSGGGGGGSGSHSMKPTASHIGNRRFQSRHPNMASVGALPLRTSPRAPTTM